MGLVHRLRDRLRQKPEGEAATAVIFVRSAPRLLAVDALSLVQKQRARGRTVVRRDAQPGSLALSIADRAALIKTLDAPYPAGELASFLRGTWWWPDVAEATRAHAGRVLVHVPIASGDARDRHLLATELVVDLLDLLDQDAVAVLWGDTGAIVPPDRFVALAKGASRTQLPVTLWISVRFATVNGERLAFTTGLRAFGLPEIESEAGAEPAPLATAVFEAAHALLIAGAHPDLHEAASKIHPRTRVLRLS